MNHENEQPANPVEQYVMLDVGGSKRICIPLDTFIEVSDKLTVLKTEGWGEDMIYLADEAPMDFKLTNAEFIATAKVKARLLNDKNSKA